MINFDMIGMYGKQGITLGGANTAKEFPDVLAEASEGVTSISSNHNPSVVVTMQAFTEKAFLSCSSTPD